MINAAREIDFYIDTLIVETLARDPSLIKQAGISSAIMDLLTKAKDYFSSKIDPNNKVGSVVNLLAPGAIAIGLGALGMPWIGALVGLAMNVFHIDVSGILRDAYEGVKSLISGGRQVSSSQVDSMMSGVIQAHRPTVPATTTSKTPTASQRLHDAKIIKLMTIEYVESGMKKEAVAGAVVATLGSKVLSVLGSVLGWIFKIVLASGGLMIAGDVVNRFLGRSTTPTKSSPSGGSGWIPASVVTTKQTKFKLNPSYDVSEQFSDPARIQRYSNTPAGIGQMLIDFAQDVYQGLEGLDGVIRSTAGFRAIVNAIVQHNQTASGGMVVFIPDMFSSKKEIVDRFIDDVAAKSP